MHMTNEPPWQTFVLSFVFLLRYGAVDEWVWWVAAGFLLRGVDGVLLHEGAAAAAEFFEALESHSQPVLIFEGLLVFVDGVCGKSVDQQSQEQVENLRKRKKDVLLHSCILSDQVTFIYLREIHRALLYSYLWQFSINVIMRVCTAY